MRTTLAAAAFAAALALVPRGPLAADEPKPPAGFTALFNGKDLTGWQGHTTMKERATLSKEKLAELQEKRNKTAREHWVIENGVIKCDGKGGVSLQTAKDYGNF